MVDGDKMKIRIQNSEKYLDVNVEHPYLLGNPDICKRELTPKLQVIIKANDLKCDGCGMLLKNKGWVAVNHRPKSARVVKETYRVENKSTGEVWGEGEFMIKDIWAVFLFCSDTCGDCISKWKDNRPK